MEENKRIEAEILSMGHSFALLDFKDFEYSVIDGKLEVENFSNIRPDIVIIRGIFNAVKPIAMFINGLRKKGVKVFDNNFTHHIYSINKIADIMKLAQADVPIPDSFHLNSFDKFISSAEKVGYPIICKLTRTGKGAGIYKFDDSASFQAFVNTLQEREAEPKSYMIQKFVPYVHDLRILIIGEEMYCMKRIPGEGEFRANFSLGGSVELFDLDEPGKELAKKALHAVDLQIGGVDMLITEDNTRYILEVNHTAGFIGMELATSTNIGKIWVEYALNNAK